MIKATGLTLWIEPPEDLKQRYSKIIKSLSLKFGTLQFEPHITLLGGINQPKKEVLDKTSKLASLIESYNIDLTGEIFCGIGDWTRTMIILAHQTKPVMDAYYLATKIFKMSGKYTPHLSLMYSEGIPLDVIQKAAKELDPNLLKATFKVKHFSLIDTEGGPESWTKFKDFKLQSTRRQS